MSAEHKTYQRSSESIDRKVWNRGALVMGCFIAMEITAALIVGRSANPQQREDIVIAGLVTILFALAVVVFSSRKLQKTWLSYQLTVFEDRIERTQDGLRPLQLDRREIAKVEEARGRHMYVGTNDRLRRVVIPADLVGYEEVREAVGEWSPLKRRTLFSRFDRQAWTALGALACWGICREFLNPVLVVSCAAAFYVLLAMAYSDTFRNPNLTKGVKVAVMASPLFLWRYLVFPFLSALSALRR